MPDSIRSQLHEIIFEADTPAGKAFDVGLLVLILLSVLVVMLESVQEINHSWGTFFYVIEWGLTVIFTLEYLLRVYLVKQSWRYILSFYGIVDLMAILPTYLSLFLVGSHYLVTIRVLRLLRVFRILKLAHFVVESEVLIEAIKASRVKITVFLGAVLTMVVIIGSLMYLIEGGPESKFTSIPRSMYWAIVTLTTVGYGDIAPETNLGQFLAAIVMILGYGIIAVPTGIVSVELANAHQRVNTRSCENCGNSQHDSDAIFCKTCGDKL